MGLPELLIIIVVIVGAVTMFFRNFSADSATSQFMKPKHAVDYVALNDADLQSYLPDRRINAIKRYRQLTGANLKTAKEIIDWAVANPSEVTKGKGAGQPADTEGAGVRDLIAAGEIDEAVRVYAAFMGVDKFTAQEAVEQMQREYRLSDDVADLLAQGRKVQAIQAYMNTTGVDLVTAKAAVEEMQS